jgi:hypothetical protein
LASATGPAKTESANAPEASNLFIFIDDLLLRSKWPLLRSPVFAGLPERLTEAVHLVREVV